MNHRLTYKLILVLVLLLPTSVFAQILGPNMSVTLCDGSCLPPPPLNPETSPGALIQYQVYVLNCGGDADATNVLYHEVVPMYTTAVQPSNQWNCTSGGEAGDSCVHNDGTVYSQCDVDSNSFLVKVNDKLPCGLEYIENTVTITYDGSTPSAAHTTTLRHKVINNDDCLPVSPESSCPSTKRYYMYTLEDANQPPGWQPYCNIISANGYPSVQIQARLCTPPGAQHTFKATNIPYGGWVYRDCHGNASYGWPYWASEWYRAEYAHSDP
jgi:hypothetical protein